MVFRWFAAVSSFYFLLVALLGVGLRGVLAGLPLPGGWEFRNLVHAHSHLAYFGWASLGLMGLVYRRLGRLPRGVLLWHLLPAALASAGAFVSFARSGYSGLSIFFSAVNGLAWYAFVLAASQGLRWAGLSRTTEGRYYLWAMVYLVLASLGSWGASAWKVLELGGELFREVSVAVFLNCFSSGWYVLGLSGAFLSLIDRRAESAFRLYLPWLVVLTLPASLNAVIPDQRLLLAPWLLYSGAMAGLGLMIPYLGLGTAVVRFSSDPFLRGAGVFLLIKGLTQPFRSLPAFAHLAGSHPLLIGDLHLSLLGVTSLGLVGLLFRSLGKERSPAWLAWLAGVAVAFMVVSLYLTGLGLVEIRVGYRAAFVSSLPLLLLPLFLVRTAAGLRAPGR